MFCAQIWFVLSNDLFLVKLEYFKRLWVQLKTLNKLLLFMKDKNSRYRIKSELIFFIKTVR